MARCAKSKYQSVSSYSHYASMDQLPVLLLPQNATAMHTAMHTAATLPRYQRSAVCPAHAYQTDVTVIGPHGRRIKTSEEQLSAPCRWHEHASLFLERSIPRAFFLCQPLAESDCKNLNETHSSVTIPQAVRIRSKSSVCSTLRGCVVSQHAIRCADVCGESEFRRGRMQHMQCAARGTPHCSNREIEYAATLRSIAEATERLWTSRPRRVYSAYLAGNTTVVECGLTLT